MAPITALSTCFPPIWGSTPLPQLHNESPRIELRLAQTSTTCIHPPNAQELHLFTVHTDDRARHQLKPEAEVIAV